MRKKIVAGNWKMNTTVAEGVELAKAVAAKSSEVPASVKLIIAPPFTHLVPVAEAIKGSVIGLSAQNCADKEKGAYTGEVSADMLVSAGCEYTILGHSERRQYYGETDTTLVEKVKLAIAHGLSPIVCVGENLDEREAGRHFDVCRRNGQSDHSLRAGMGYRYRQDRYCRTGSGDPRMHQESRGGEIRNPRRGNHHSLRRQLQTVQRKGTVRMP